MNRKAIVFGCLVALLLMGILPSVQAKTSSKSSMITSVRYKNLDLEQTDKQELDGLLAIKRNSILSLKDLAENAKLIRTFLKLSAVHTAITATDRGIEVEYTLVPYPVINKIIVDHPAVSRRFLRRDFVGRRIYPTNIREIVQQVESELDEDSFTDYEVNVTFTEVRTDSRMETILNIDVGGAIRRRIVDADAPDELAKSLRGEWYSPIQSKAEIQDYVVDLRDAGYWAATANYAVTTSDAAGVVLAIELSDEDVLYSTRYLGMKLFEPEEMDELIYPDTSREFRTVELTQIKDRIIKQYADYGHFEADVEIVVTKIDNRRVVTVNIREGRPASVNAIEIQGLDEELHKKLLAVLPNTASKWLHLTSDQSRRLHAEDIVETRDIVTNFLEDQGFFDFRGLQVNHVRDSDGYTLQISVNAGEPYRFAEIIDADKLPGVISLPPWEQGEVFSGGKLAQWIGAVRSQLSSRGYLDSTLEVERTIVRSRKEVRIRVKGDAGTSYTIRSLYLKGIGRRHQKVLNRLFPMRPGDIATDVDVSELRRRLFLLNLYQNIEVRWFNRDTSKGLVDVLVHVENASAGEVSLGIGINTSPTEGLSAQLLAEHRNLIGHLRKIQVVGRLQYRYTTLLNNFEMDNPSRARIELNFFERWLFGTKWQGRLSVGVVRDTREADHDFVQYFGLVGADTGILERLYQFAYYSFSQTRKFLTFNPLLNPLETERVAKLNYLLTFASLDNRFDPRDGWILKSKFGVAHAAWGSEFDFGLVELGGTLLQPFARNFTFFATVNGGLIVPFTQGNYLPRFEKFRLGGVQSVRGYASDSIGLLTNSGSFAADYVNVGGLRKGSYQIELRFRTVAELETVLFHDAGAVWSTELNNIPGIPSSGMGAAVGGGLMYHTPIGPIRLDVGTKLIDNEIDTGRTNVHFYVGALL